MDAKKISFGFSKVAKKPNILPTKAPKEESKVELIKCLEGKEIKLVAEKQEVAPLIIQLASNQKTSTALASLMKRRAVLLGEDEPEPEETTEEPQSIADVTNLEQRAARELLAAAQENGNEAAAGEKLVLPALKADELPLDGAKESSLDDYDSIPIQQFGLAMLRGMGWKDPPPVSKKKGAAPVDDAPFMRPKGMGLGADKALKVKTLLVEPEKNEVLEIKKQAFVRILGGKQKDQYGQIEGFDDHAGRVIVKMAIGGSKEAFNEFLCQPVSRKEYSQYGKCINSAKYDEFKKQENEHGQIIVKREKSTERRSSNTQNNRERQREEEQRKHKTREEDRKPYGNEHRSIKPESRSYKEERGSYKQEERKPYKTEERSRDAAAHSSSRYQERRRDAEHSSSNRGQESRSNSSTSKSSNRRRQQSSSDEAEDTGESTESDSDSAYERKHKKKANKSHKSKKKSKKSKSKSQRHRHHSSATEDSDDSSAAEENSRHRQPSKHKKKTKKSKHARSRTRSRSREGRGR